MTAFSSIIADLYIRVSTDEQAEKGYSQRNQEEVLRKYCSINYIEVRNVIYEDHSAKTFNRPQWNKLLLNLKREKNKCDFVLFTKWDRFSRNAGDAYQMISVLRKLGVEPQAIEQPLDLSIPENKMMLAFYLAAPEVENDRRALNTFHGMRRAKKEGRYMGTAPFGYANKSKEDGTKYIALVEPAASVMRWIFEEIARGVFNTEQVYHLACRRGFTRTKSNMWGLIRNPIYCGKIFVPQYKDEESMLVTGQHEPLITEGLFYNVQDILDGKSRIYRPKIKTVVEFPLRGFFNCPKCQKKLQGSKCKGRHKHYYYYHCEAQCKFRINSEIANKLFIDDLKKYQPIPEVKKIYTSVIFETHRELANNAGEQKRRLLEQIKDYELRLSNARDLLLTSKIDSDDYKLMKDDYTIRITNLERELSSIAKDRHSIESLLNKGIENLIKMNEAYVDMDLSEARSLIGLVYPENFTIRENKIQTARVNKIVESIYLINKELRDKKNGTKDDFYLLSHRVTSTGFKPVTF
ncbi:MULTISPECIES: recombinase family protein [Flavobacterium]|uniref:recombinase family protein n=1 Tax=Flavobacterium TaxID=237 RepID=UPI001C881CF6|nr:MULTISPECIES: recombinase family protein [Flavobacterium]